MNVGLDITTHHPIAQKLCQEGLVAVVRSQNTHEARWGIETLIEGGITAIELTLSIPDAMPLLKGLVADYPNTLFGMGSLLTDNDADKAQEAGAQFLVSPVFHPAMTNWIPDTAAQDTLLIPGVATPSELYHAYEAGFRLIKVFPVNALGGSAYLKALKDPLKAILRHCYLFPTGGIGLHQMGDYWQAGAAVVGLGESLLSQEILQNQDESTLKRRIQETFAQRQLFLTKVSTGRAS